MDDEELDEIRRRKYAELQHAQEQAMVQAQAKEQVLAQRELILRQILTPEARERLARIELAYPDLTESIESQLIGLAQSGRVQRVIELVLTGYLEARPVGPSQLHEPILAQRKTGTEPVSPARFPDQ